MTDKAIITPVITSISPTTGKAGDKLIINGSGFVDGNNVHGVFFDDVPASGWAVAEDGKITDVVVTTKFDHGDRAPISGSVKVTVRTEGGIDNFGGDPQTSNAVSFSITA
jgi:hypothetical protein